MKSEICPYLESKLREGERALLALSDSGVEALRATDKDQLGHWMLLNARNYYCWLVPKVIPSYEDAEDLAAEFAHEFVKYLDRIDGPVLAWARGMLGTLKRRYWGRKRKHEERFVALADQNRVWAAPRDEWQEDLWRLQELFLKEMANAPPLVREVIRRRLAEEPPPTYRQLAAELRTTEKTIKTRIHEFMVQCREKYQSR